MGGAEMELICPVCGNQLHKADRSYVCENRHSFDIARQGYVNLLTVQQKHSLAPGDTREQVLSRRSFLEADFYAPIARTLIETAKKYVLLSKHDYYFKHIRLIDQTQLLPSRLTYVIPIITCRLTLFNLLLGNFYLYLLYYERVQK